MGECPGYLPRVWEGGRLEQQVPRPTRLSSVRLLPALQLLLWHSVLWPGQEAIPLVTVSSLPPSPPLPRSFLLKSLEQVRKIRASSLELLEQLVSGQGSANEKRTT